MLNLALCSLKPEVLESLTFLISLIACNLLATEDSKTTGNKSLSGLLTFFLSSPAFLTKILSSKCVLFSVHGQNNLFPALLIESDLIKKLIFLFLL